MLIMENTFLAVLLIVQLTCYTCTKAESTLQLTENSLGAKGTHVNVTSLLDWPSTELFLSNFAKASKPFIVRGAAKDWPAYQKWTDEYFLSFVEEGRKEGVTVEQGKKEDREKPAEEISFHKFVNRYQKQDWYLVNGVAPFLRKDIILPPPFQCQHMADLLLEQMMWFSSGGTKSVLHFDFMDNIHCLVAGRKLFILIDPTNKVDIDQPQGSYSSVDVDNVDYEKYPDLLTMQYQYANLTAGDCLYLPYHWYHQVRGVDRNIGINLWWDHHTMMTLDSSKCTDLPSPHIKTLDQVHFPGTGKLMKDEETVKARFLLLASQENTPLNLERLLLTLLGRKEQREEMPGNEEIEASIQTVFTAFDQNLDGKVVPDEVETLPKESWVVIRNEFQRMEQHFRELSRQEESFGLDELDAPQDWDDTQDNEPQYDDYSKTLFIDDQDMDYVHYYTDIKDEL